MPRPAKVRRLSQFEHVGAVGEVYSKSKLFVAADIFQYERKVPYIIALINVNGRLIFGLIDERVVEIGDKVIASVGALGVNDMGIHIYGSIWRKKRGYETPIMKHYGEKRELPKDARVGIEGYGIYIPKNRLDLSTLSPVWGRSARGIKSFPGDFDDQATYACNAALDALNHAKAQGREIKFIEVGSESKVYSVKPTASIVSGLLKCSSCFAADNEFACKAGTQSFVNAYNFAAVNGGRSLAIGADSAQGAPNDVLELTAGDGAAAYVLGKNSPIALIEGMVSYTTDTADFWRNEGKKFPQHAGRFSGDPSFYKHTIGAAKHLMNKLKLEPKDFDYAVFHQPNSKFPRVAGKLLGFTTEQVEPGIVFDWIGNTYSANSLLGLAKVLDMAAPYRRILIVSYGSGAGSDAISMVTTPEIEKKRSEKKRSVKSWLGETDQDTILVEGYGKYLKNKGII
jgi:hydroxymethylglutaryl-CoA synthase